MKCDEGQPTCSMCQASNIACGGYAKRLFFDCDGDEVEETQRYRRPLFSEDERRQMSSELINCVRPSQVSAHLTEIDEAVEESRLEDIQAVRGPFNAFKFVLSPRTKQNRDAPSLPADDTAQLPVMTSSSPLLETDFADNLQLCFDPIASSNDPPPSEKDAGGEESTVNTDSVYDILHDLQMADFLNEDNTAHTFDTYDPKLENDGGLRACRYEIEQDIPREVDTTVPHNAIYLLKHYSSTVLGLLTPFRHGKTPWHILFLPHSKVTLAALMLGESVDHASLGAFYGTLAISALSLGGIFNSERWTHEGELYAELAASQVQRMVQRAYETKKDAKYKSILIALLTMLQISILTNNRGQTELYFLEVEKFIRLRGLRKNKSRKVRLLHHCYSFERLLYESTLVASETSSQRSDVQRAVESSDAAPYSLDSLSFALSTWTNLDQELLKVKNKEEGENDLHLHIPGVWSATLYPEIFGLPELHLFLISLIVRLGKEKDRSERSNVHSISLKEFMEQARAIERCIDQLQWMDLPKSCSSNPPSQTVSDFVNAIQHALGIYFYRRIYDLDTSLLQQKVLAVRDSLKRFEKTGDDSSFGYSRFIWPAFIAASEAEDPDVQASFSSWFKSSAQRSGLQIFRDKLCDIEEIWESGGRVSWLDIVARRNSSVRGFKQSPAPLLSMCSV